VSDPTLLPPIAPERFVECLRVCHWPYRTFASIIGYDEASVRRYAKGEVRVPSGVAQWLLSVTEYIENNPPALITKPKMRAPKRKPSNPERM